MAYKITEFDGVQVPLYDARQQIQTAVVDSTLVDVPGGTFDWLGSTQQLGRKQGIDVTGLLFGDVMMTADDAGNTLVDEGDNVMIAGSSPTHLRSLWLALTSRVGKRGTLWRERLDDTSTREWITARLLSVSWPRTVDQRDVLAEATLRFESAMYAWRASSPTVASVNTTSAALVGLIVNNGGDVPVTDATITVTRTSGTLTAARVIGAGIDIAWSGSVGASQVLTIDCDRQTVQVSGVDAYSGFSLQSGHTQRGWLRFEQGTTGLIVSATGGNATIAVTHYNQWA